MEPDDIFSTYDRVDGLGGAVGSATVSVDTGAACCAVATVLGLGTVGGEGWLKLFEAGAAL